MPGWRVWAVAAVLLGYAGLSFLLMTYAPAEPWTIAALFGPLLVGLAASGIKRRHAPTLVLCVALVLALGAVAARGGIGMNTLYVAQHAFMHLALAASFGVTLRAGSTPLITAAAQRVHVNFTPAMRAYTGWLTKLWVVYFLGMVGVSLAVYLLAPWSWWSLFCNVVTPAAAIGLFVGEHLVRQIRHPDFEPITLAGVARAFQAQRASTP